MRHIPDRRIGNAVTGKPRPCVSKSMAWSMRALRVASSAGSKRAGLWEIIAKSRFFRDCLEAGIGLDGQRRSGDRGHDGDRQRLIVLGAQIPQQANPAV